MAGEGLGEFVKKRRSELGLSQRRLAKQAGMSASYLSQIEKGATTWPKKYIAALARELRVGEDELAIAAGIIAQFPQRRTMTHVAHEIGRDYLRDASISGYEKFGDLVAEFVDADDDTKLTMYLIAIRISMGALALTSDLKEDDVQAFLERMRETDDPEVANLQATL